MISQIVLFYSHILIKNMLDFFYTNKNLKIRHLFTGNLLD